MFKDLTTSAIIITMKSKPCKNEYKPFFFPFPQKLLSGKIINRYKRFLADVILDNGEAVTAHVANSGSMTTCWEKDAVVALTWHGENNERKLKYSLQAVKMPDGWVSVNTMNPNKAVAQAIIAGAIPSLQGYELLQSETKASVGSRFDLTLYNSRQGKAANTELLLKPERAGKIENQATSRKSDLPITIVEIKNATLRDHEGVTFPDAVTTRGQKHLHHLITLKKAGYRCIILFFAGRSNTRWVAPARIIDPAYAESLKEAVECGVEALALKVDVSADGLMIMGEIPVNI